MGPRALDLHPLRRAPVCGVLGLVLSAALVPTAAHAQERLRKGPWVMNHREGRITILAERASPGAVSVRAWREVRPGERQPPPRTVHSDGPGYLHEVVLDQLTPGTRYRYEVTGQNLTPQGGGFNTAPAEGSGEPFRFILYGDTRSNANAHAATVNAMRREGADFVVHTGDLVADGRREGMWQEFFEIERDLLRSSIFVPIVGNHELRAPMREGVANFRKYVHCDPDSPNPELDYVVRYGNVRLILSNAYENWADAPMRPWLEGQLARARQEAPDDFLLVVMHWGMHSSGPHGPNNRLRRGGMLDLFRRYGVDLIVAGHDHLYERGTDQGLRYLVTGGGGAGLYRRERHLPYTEAFVAAHHYVRVDAAPGRLDLTAVRADGSVLDRFRIARARTRPAAQSNARVAPALAPPITASEELPPEEEGSDTVARRRRRGRRIHTRTCLCAAPGAGLTHDRGIALAALGGLAVTLAARARRRGPRP